MSSCISMEVIGLIPTRNSEIFNHCQATIVIHDFTAGELNVIPSFLHGSYCRPSNSTLIEVEESLFSGAGGKGGGEGINLH